MNLLEQLFSFVRIFDADAMVGEILQECAAVDIRTGEYRLFAALERLMLHKLDAVAVVDECIAGDACFLLVGLAEPAVYDEPFAVGTDRCLAFDRPDGHMTVDDAAGLRIQTEFLEDVPADLLIVRQREISAFLLLVRVWELTTDR